MKNIFVFLLCSFIHVGVKAGVLLQVNGTYLADNVKSSSSTDSLKYGYGVGALFSINKNLWGGWSYSGFTASLTSQNVTTNLAGQDTGPTLLWQFGRGKAFSAGLTYNILSQATYTTSTGHEEWTGSSFLVQVGALPEIKNNLRLGVTLNYFLATYTKKKIQNVESSASYGRQWLYPSISLSKEF